MSRARYVTGLRAVEQLMSRQPGDIVKIYAEYRANNPRVETIIANARDRGLEIQSANRARLKQMSGEARHQGVVAEIRRSQALDEAALRDLVEQRLQDDAKLLVLVLDGIQDPHNLGACLRTADAAGVDVVIVPRHGAAGLGPTVSKVAAGAAEVVPFATVANVVRVLGWLKDYGVTIIGTSDAPDDSVYDCDLTGSVAIVMGEEHAGLKSNIAARCDRVVSLPMQGSVSSLNVSVATALCLYEAVRQRRQVID